MTTHAGWLGAVAVAIAAAGPADEGPFVRALWLVQAHGPAEAIAPGADSATKARLAKALGKAGVLDARGAEGLMASEAFAKLAGDDGKLDGAEIAAAVANATPSTRVALPAALRSYGDLLTTGYDQIADDHREPARALADWIVANYRPGEPLPVVFVCTGNSRRSILGASLLNLAGAYHGLPELRGHSGGTDPSAFNARTIAALRAVGFAIEPTGDEAPRGEPATPNPVHRVAWGEGETTTAVEFSKRYDDPANPRSGFAAVMVCTEADGACPIVPGASARIKMTFLDPKLYDGSSLESAKYAEHRDDIGRTLFWAVMEARRRLAAEGRLR